MACIKYVGLLFAFTLILANHPNMSEAISDCAKDCMPNCLRVEGASIPSCETSCEGYCDQKDGQGGV